MRAISKKIQNMFELSCLEPTQENVNNLKVVYKFGTLISKLPEWTFDIKMLISISGTIIVPVIVILLENLINRLFT